MEEYKRKKADGTFIPPEIVPKTKGKPGPKPKVKDAAVVATSESDVNRVEQIVVKEEIQDSESMSCSETNSAIDGAEDSDDIHDNDQDDNHYGHHDEGAASDFEDL